MTALKIIGIVLAVFLLLGFVRVGARATFGDETTVRVRVGWLSLTVYPNEWKKPSEGEKQPEKPKKPAKKKPKKRRRLPKPTWEELFDLLQTSLAALGATLRCACRRVRIDPLDITAVIGRRDPSETGFLYGMASAALYALMPRAEALFHIPNPSLHLRAGFETGESSADGTIGVSLRVCDLIAIALTLTVPTLCWFLRYRRAHRHDRAPDAADIDGKTDNRQDKIA